MADLEERIRKAVAGRYDIQRQLGAGGMAVVFLAHDLKHDRNVAVKVLRPELTAALGPQRFLGEIRIAAALSHPHILPVFNSGEADGLLYYVMPHIEGESLRARLARERKLPVPEAARLLREIADALACAHRHGVVHRDIKPDNVLLSEGHAQVMDFGLAKAMSVASTHDTMTLVGAAVGTPAYMAPEQASAEGQVDQRADIYALGVMAYELLGGRTPFQGTTAQQVMSAHVSEVPRPVSQFRDNLPSALVSVVTRCLEKEPADRWQSAEEILPHLDGVLTPGSGMKPVGGVKPVARPRRGLLLAGGALVVAAGLGWGLSGLLTSSAAEGIPVSELPSVAVLPFQDPSAGEEGAYFGDGMAEALINALGKIEGLKVAGQTSAFSFKDRPADVRTIGEQLGVGTILSGSVRRDGQRVRIGVRLENAQDGFLLWSESYNEQLDDIFGIQDRIARAVAAELRVELLAGANAPLVVPATENLEAYNLYLQGRYFWDQRGDGIRRGLELFRQAVDLDPEYALAHAGIADAYVLLGVYGDLRPEEAMPQAKAAALAALELDDSLGEAHTTLGFAALTHDWDWAVAKDHFERALALKPNYVTAHYWYAIYLVCVEGRFDEAVAHCQRAVELEPVAPHAANMVGHVLLYSGRPEEAIPHLLRAVELASSWTNHRVLSEAYYHMGDYDQAIAAAETTLELSRRHPWALYNLGVALASAGHTARAEALLEELVERRDSGYAQAAFIGIGAAALGRTDEAMEWLETAYQERDAILVMLHGLVNIPPELQRDPRFARFWERMGLR